MPSGVFKVTEIPEDRVADVIGMYQPDGPTSIERVEQSNGKWTVIATFPGPGETTQVFTGDPGTT